ncbi:hypothetical protein [Lacimicrobium alkaliphilum]|uniref:DUF2306 domain-containing protein n=1 Tax=Lacimicrobium alkaliphilum TaxID=1526571 RepID=A0A0U3B2X7_9ALTE|nr:hypothetical protein [Lacimicrobium alkaliphilum]ALS99576.1 hypothetical protein AT746_15800 [Lacimicrobium alkaliphilum]
MLMLHNILLMFHIAIGTAALLLFWAPALMKKGSLDHVKFGRYYANVMYLVAGSGLIMSTLVLINPMAIHGEGVPPDSAAQVSNQIRIFSAFLLYLSWLVLTSVRHGILVLRCKQDRSPLRSVSHLGLLVMLFVGAILLTLLGISSGKTLFLVFGPLGLFISAGMLHYVLRPSIKPMQWWIEHLGAMIGSGIGAYTAFLAFGARVILADSGYFQLLAWVAPGVIGAVIISLQSRKYSKRFAQIKESK